MVEFLKIQYRLGRITELQLDKLVVEDKIEVEDKQYIMN